MPATRIQSLKIKAKLLQKAKKRAGKPVQLKTALAIVAKASGFKSWRELTRTLETSGNFSFPRSTAHWNTWYASYEKARKHLDAYGGYLLPHEKHFFICDAHYIENLGIKSTDTDLKKVGNDWTSPRNAESWERLLKKINRGKT